MSVIRYTCCSDREGFPDMEEFPDGDYVIYRDHHELQQRYENLKTYITLWDDVDQYVRDHPSIKLGDSVPEATLRLLQDRDDKSLPEGFHLQDEGGIMLITGPDGHQCVAYPEESIYQLIKLLLEK